MREILFRGKRVDNNEWVYGFLSKSRDSNHFLSLCIDHEENGVMLSSIVEPKTIGQYTGLTDKNGVKIFEGDIVQIVNTGDEICLIEWDDDDAAFEVANNDVTQSFLVNLWGRDVEVIGNIHDNPELAEGRL